MIVHFVTLFENQENYLEFDNLECFFVFFNFAKGLAKSCERMSNFLEP